METYLIGFIILLVYAGECSSYYWINYFPGHATVGYAEHWSYHGHLGPDHWPQLPIKNNQCGGRRQSPINIDTKTVKYTGRRLSFSHHNLVYFQSSLFNNGHNVNLTINKFYNRPKIQVTFPSGNTKTYVFDSLHYHFGDVSDHGSEHQVNEQKFPMEMHSIYFKEKYGSYEKAKTFPDGLAIVAVLFNVTTSDNSRLSAITSKLAEVAHPDVLAVVPQVLLSDLFPQDPSHFFTYKGSLTTPPCTEVATWYILREKYPVSEQQMQRFRQLTKKGDIRSSIGNDDGSDENSSHFGHTHSYLADNVRPVQPLNNRPVYMHF